MPEPMFTQDIKDKISDIHKTLVGNGDPKRGMISRLATIETTLVIHGWMLGLLTASIIGAAIKVLWV